MRLHIVSGDTNFNFVQADYSRFPIMRLHIVSGDLNIVKTTKKVWSFQLCASTLLVETLAVEASMPKDAEFPIMRLHIVSGDCWSR